MIEKIGICEHCKKNFKYYLIHNGFNDTSYAYCNKCGMTVFLDEYFSNIPKQCHIFFEGKNRYEKINKLIEPFLKPCVCGGRFTRKAMPRCSHCNSTLSAIKAGVYIEKNSPGVKKGARWQGSWNGIYAIVIEGKIAENIWIKK